MNKNKRVGILTFHFVENQGAVLQAFALQTMIERLGYEVDVINYCPEYHTKDYNIFISPVYIFNKNINLGRSFINSFLRAIYSQRRNKWLFRRMKSKKKYEEFRQKYLNRTKKISSYEQLCNIEKDYYAIIVGSDQIWNIKMTNGIFDYAYFGIQGEKKDCTRRVAYAASAMGQINQKNKYDFIELAKEIHFISTREQDLTSQISGWLDKKCETVLDPTFLLSKQEWCQKIKDKESINLYGKYLLIYKSRGEEFNSIAKEIALSRGLKIIEVELYRSINNSLLLYDTAPDEFVSLIKNAECVFAGSFHGTALSIIFEKEFYSYVPNNLLNGGDSRITNILRELEIEDRIIYEKSNIYNENKMINYKEVKNKLETLRTKSISFLEKSLNCGEKDDSI